MTLKKISSAGLLALAALIIGLIIADGAFAQTAAPAAAARRRRRRRNWIPATPPGC